MVLKQSMELLTQCGLTKAHVKHLINLESKHGSSTSFEGDCL